MTCPLLEFLHALGVRMTPGSQESRNVQASGEAWEELVTQTGWGAASGPGLKSYPCSPRIHVAAPEVSIVPFLILPRSLSWLWQVVEPRHFVCLASGYTYAMLSSRSFIVLKLTFRSMAQLDLIFVYNMK